MNVLTYKGLSATVSFDADDMILIGRIAGINDVIGFHADNPDELVRVFHEAVDDYLQTCRQAGKSPERPYSGKLMFRVDPSLHARAARAAELAGKSLNQWGEETLRSAVGG